MVRQVGGKSAHNNMPPYIVVKRWHKDSIGERKVMIGNKKDLLKIAIPYYKNGKIVCGDRKRNPIIYRRLQPLVVIVT